MWDEVLLFLVPFRSKNFYIFLDLVIFPYFNAISIDFNAFFNLHLLCNFHVFMWKNAYIKDLNALRIVMNMDRMIGGILFLSCVFVCLSVCLSVVNFNIGYNF